MEFLDPFWMAENTSVTVCLFFHPETSGFSVPEFGELWDPFQIMAFVICLEMEVDS